MKTERLFKSTLDDGGVIIMKVTDMAVLSGGGYQVNGLFGVAVAPVAVGESGAFKTAGVHNLAKPSSEEWAIGDRIAWDNDNRECKKLSQFGDVIGVAIEAAANPSSTGRVWLHGFVRAESEFGVVSYTSAEPVSHTGDTDEFTLATVTIPGGLLQANSAIEISALAKSATSVPDTPVMFNLYFGGILYGEWDFTNSQTFIKSGEIVRTIYCNNSVFAQKSVNKETFYDFESKDLTTSSVDTTVDVDLVFKVLLDDVSSVFTLEGYVITLIGV